MEERDPFDLMEEALGPERGPGWRFYDDPPPNEPKPDGPRRRRAKNGASDGTEGDAEEGYIWPFRLGRGGVEKRIERADKESGTVTIEWKWFCSSLEVGAETRSAEGEEWGRLLRVTDRDNRVKDWGMPMAMLAGDGTSYRERLLSLGLVMAPGKFARDALHEYISTARPKTKARCVGRVGWHLRAFALSNQTVEQRHG